MCKQEVHAGFSGCKQLQGSVPQASNLPNAMLCKLMQGLLMISTKMGTFLSSESQCAELAPFANDLQIVSPFAFLRIARKISFE